MAEKLKTKRKFPWSAKFGEEKITFRLMTEEDRNRVLKFAKSLPAEDFIFLRMDISNPEVIDDWVEAITAGRTITVLTENEAGNIIGYASLHYNRLSWTRHLGEIRVFVRSDIRGSGLGKRLIGEMFQLAKEQGLKRIVVNIPSNQPRVRQMLEKVGFQPEALLTDWLIDAKDLTYDLLVMSAHVEE